MALQLPQQPNDPRVVLPQAPENPPALSNVYCAVKLKHNVLDTSFVFFAYHVILYRQ
jgi:hypothetical protein